MIVVSLDEYGKFENQKEAKFIIVAGIVFIGKNENSVLNEQNRIETWLKECCERVGANYPGDLHAHRTQTGNITNMQPYLAVKKEVHSSLSDFLSGSIPWKPYDGEYRVFCTVGNTQNSPKCFNCSGNMISDSIAANRYQHIANSTVRHLLFDVDELLPEDNVRLDLATRTNVINNPLKQDEYYHSGHERKVDWKTKETNAYISVANQDSYRGVIMSALTASDGKRNLQVEMNVNSIDYNYAKDKSEYSFFYLADIVCSWFEEYMYKRKGGTSIEYLSQQIKEACLEIAGDGKYYLWIYDEIDHFYNRALKCFEAKDYYHSLEYIYDARIYNSRLSEIYECTWFRKLESRIIDSKDLIASKRAIEYLYQYVQSPNYSNTKGEYILGIFNKQLLQYAHDANNSSLLFDYYWLEMTINNHNGKHAEATVSYEEACRYSAGVSMEKYCELRNTRSVSLTDSVHYEEALNNTLKTVAIMEKYSNLMMEMGNEKSSPVLLGATYSQLGQCYAFLSRNAEAKVAFEKALAIIGSDSVNRQRTLSYYLHLLIEMNDKEGYEKYIDEYFGSRDFKDLCKLDDTSFKFALFVYMKAAFVLYKDSLSNDAISSLLDWFDSKISDGTFINEHPTEMLYKYAAFLSLLIGCNDRAENYMNKTDLFGNSELMLNIVQNGHEEYKRLLGNTDPFGDDSYVYMYR